MVTTISLAIDQSLDFNALSIQTRIEVNLHAISNKSHFQYALPKRQLSRF